MSQKLEADIDGMRFHWMRMSGPVNTDWAWDKIPDSGAARYYDPSAGRSYL